jgi:hypothetical protein
VSRKGARLSRIGRHGVAALERLEGMAPPPDRADRAARQCGRPWLYAEPVMVVASHLCDLVDRYIAVQRMVLARYPEYGDATGRAAFGARLDQLEALIRETGRGGRRVRSCPATAGFSDSGMGDDRNSGGTTCRG